MMVFRTRATEEKSQRGTQPDLMLLVPTAQAWPAEGALAQLSLGWQGRMTGGRRPGLQCGDCREEASGLEAIPRGC